MANHNGFADALKQINTLINVNQQVALDTLEEAAQYFVEKLRPKIPESKKNKKHLQDALKVVVKGDRVQVIFEGDFFYWHLVEHGHRKVNGGKVKGRHFVRNTIDKESQKIASMMLNKIIKKMGG
ncbi:HK97-gp10 family putative phage morphogenesis protein [Rummeliibacillus suwonensis]|uniref:HK97-gp10 family putative phage morphogenesis protein n=1 Tax=Rummeliibacillus suwonensis TaxID=1306154 RepID=UPI0028A298FE|nr:HK97-gp10 family putative phage morphogenesis protein [Rummeliibacillus suwonensis]